MPVYDYKCKEHGLFFELQTMADSDKPKACPTCGILCSRIIMVAPSYLSMPKEKRLAHSKNEAMQHEPLVSSEDQRQNDDAHRKACGCKKRGSKMLYTAEGNKIFPSMRPWMISH